jgi:hypothetical protein
MAISQGSFSSGPFGLALQAWALIVGSTGASLKSQGVASVTRVSAGLYRVTLSVGVLLQAQVIARLTSTANNPPATTYTRMISSTVAEISVMQGATPIDVDGLHVEVWV